MPRIPGIIEARREVQEGDLALLGSCFVFIEMTRERVRRAVEITNMHGLLDPIDEFQLEIAKRIRKAQSVKSIKEIDHV
jgi:hypothetical protein